MVLNSKARHNDEETVRQMSKPTLTLRRYSRPMKGAPEDKVEYPAGTAEFRGGYVTHEITIDNEHRSDLSREQLTILAHALVNSVRMIATMGEQTEEVIRRDNMRRVPAIDLLMSFFEIDTETFALLQKD